MEVNMSKESEDSKLIEKIVQDVSNGKGADPGLCTTLFGTNDDYGERQMGFLVGTTHIPSIRDPDIRRAAIKVAIYQYFADDDTKRQKIPQVIAEYVADAVLHDEKIGMRHHQGKAQSYTKEITLAKVEELTQNVAAIATTVLGERPQSEQRKALADVSRDIVGAAIGHTKGH